MWRQVRGAGLAYGYFVYPAVSTGQLHLSLYKATHPVKAYQEARRIVMDQVGHLHLHLHLLPLLHRHTCDR